MRGVELRGGEVEGKGVEQMLHFHWFKCIFMQISRSVNYARRIGMRNAFGICAQWKLQYHFHLLMAYVKSHLPAQLKLWHYKQKK